MLAQRQRPGAAATAVLLCVTGSIATVPEAQAVDVAPTGVNICFGTGFSFGLFGGIVDVDNTGGVEILLPSRNDLVKLDSDVDTFGAGTLTRSLRLINSSGAEVWSSPVSLVLGVDDVLSAYTDDVTPAKFMNLANSRLNAFYPYPTVCEGYGIAEAGGQRYVIAALGVSAAEGDENSGTDYSVVKLFVINPANGNVVATHKYAAQSNNYLLINESGVGDFDGDGDDEVFTVRTLNLGKSGSKERFKVIVESFNLLTKASEDRVVLFKTDEFANQNPLP